MYSSPRVGGSNHDLRLLLHHWLCAVSTLFLFAQQLEVSSSGDDSPRTFLAHLLVVSTFSIYPSFVIAHLLVVSTFSIYPSFVIAHLLMVSTFSVYPSFARFVLQSVTIVCRILPESSRWLLSKGRQTEAKQILNKVAKTNNVVIPEKVLDNLGAVTTNDDEGKGKHSALDLVRYPNLRNRSLNIFFNW
uniref:Uncharacterized protein n=1 Tax=Timema tahoe TaxID=61484 RepID=A0A7R9ICI5_9NEOP|nr:unnamed protein product [Timema tahoe]